MEPLREAQAMAKLGPMPLHLADARQLKARIELSEGQIARACTHRDQASVLIDGHGYGRGAICLAVLDAEIAYAGNMRNREGIITAAIRAVRGDPYYDDHSRANIGGGWWNLLPRLEALRPEDDFELAKLRLARDNYNDERDAHLAARENRPSSQSTQLLSIAHPRRTPLHLPAPLAIIEQIHQDDTAAPDQPILDEQHSAIRDAIYAVLADTLTATAPEPAGVPEIALETLLADPAAEWPVHTIMQQYGIYGSVEELPLETKRFIAGKLAEQGLVKAGGLPALQQQPSLANPAKKAGWWPFAGN
jgi:hypothetical protein